MTVTDRRKVQEFVFRLYFVFVFWSHPMEAIYDRINPQSEDEALYVHMPGEFE